MTKELNDISDELNNLTSSEKSELDKELNDIIDNYYRKQEEKQT